ncbi:ester cyclase [Nocardiopsis composta]
MALLEKAYAPYTGPEEFIREWTDRIWVRRGIGLIRENYAADAVVHGAYGTTVGVEPVVRGTLERISAFPDRVGQAEDVVWEARGDDAFVSSHLILSTGSHSRTSRYGPPSDRPFASRAIATCLYRGGVMEEEWVVRDEYAIVQELGFDPEQAARELAFTEGLGLGDVPAAPLAAGVSGPRPDAHRAECEHVLGLIEEVWNGRRLDLVADYTERDVLCQTPGTARPPARTATRRPCWTCWPRSRTAGSRCWTWPPSTPTGTEACASPRCGCSAAPTRASPLRPDDGRPGGGTGSLAVPVPSGPDRPGDPDLRRTRRAHPDRPRPRRPALTVPRPVRTAGPSASGPPRSSAAVRPGRCQGARSCRPSGARRRTRSDMKAA